LPYFYKAEIAREIRKQLQIKQCTNLAEIMHDIDKTTMKNTEKLEFYKQSELEKNIHNIVEDWSPANPFFHGNLIDELGPIGKFKISSPESKEFMPKFMKKIPRAKIFEIINESAQKNSEPKPMQAQPIEEKNTDKSQVTPETPLCLEENINELKSDKIIVEFDKNTGLLITIDKDYIQTEFEMKTLGDSELAGQTPCKKKQEMKNEKIAMKLDSVKENLVKLDIREVINETSIS